MPGGGTLGISGWGCAAGNLEPLTYTRATILDKINGKPRPPLPPKSRMGKWRVFALRVPSSLIWGGWGFAVPFCPRLSESLDWRYSQRHDSNHDKKSAFKRFKAKCFQSKPGHLSVNSYKTEELRLFHLYKINK